MDCIVTRNVKDYTKSSVKVCEPSAFLKLIEEEKIKNVWRESGMGFLLQIRSVISIGLFFMLE